MLEKLEPANNNDVGAKGQSGFQLLVGLLSCTQMIHHLLCLGDEEGLTEDGHVRKCVRGKIPCMCMHPWLLKLILIHMAILHHCHWPPTVVTPVPS